VLWVYQKSMSRLPFFFPKCKQFQDISLRNRVSDVTELFLIQMTKTVSISVASLLGSKELRDFILFEIRTLLSRNLRYVEIN
jgi:hypothetical protein